MKTVDILRIAAFLIFAVNALLHLFWHKHGNLTKALLLPSVLLCYLLVADDISVFAVIAFIASFLGDVLLEKSGPKWFTAGGISFMFSHLMFTLFYSTKIDFSRVNIILIPVASIIYFFALFTTISKIKQPGLQIKPGLLMLYLLINGAMNIFALMLLQTLPCIGTVLIYAGAVLFFVSDNCLFIECFHKKKPNLFYPVMVTYIAGEFLIAMGAAAV